MGVSCKRNETKLIARYINCKLYSINTCLWTHIVSEISEASKIMLSEIRELRRTKTSSIIPERWILKSSEVPKWETGKHCKVTFVEFLDFSWHFGENFPKKWCHFLVPKNHRFWLAIFSFFMLEIANQIHYNIPALPNSFLGRQERVGCV